MHNGRRSRPLLSVLSICGVLIVGRGLAQGQESQQRSVEPFIGAVIRETAAACPLRSPSSPRNARWRSQVVGAGRSAPDVDATATDARPRTANTADAWTWAALRRRVFNLDVLDCPRCGGRLRVIATVQDPAVVGSSAWRGDGCRAYARLDGAEGPDHAIQAAIRRESVSDPIQTDGFGVARIGTAPS